MKLQRDRLNRFPHFLTLEELFVLAILRPAQARHALRELLASLVVMLIPARNTDVITFGRGEIPFAVRWLFGVGFHSQEKLVMLVVYRGYTPSAILGHRRLLGFNFV